MIAESPADVVVDLAGLTKRYGRFLAVDDLHLQVPRGSVLGLIGPNGAGKSTTLKMLMGLLSIDRGTARVLGHDVAAFPSRMRRQAGYVPETHHIYRWMRVGDALRFARAFYPTWDDAWCSELLDRFLLDPNKKVRHLSKGMLAKLALAIAAAHRPPLLVLDEPLSGLDPLVREEFLDGVLKTICRQETTVLFSSHSIDDVQRLADTVAILYRGKLLAHHPVEQLLASTKRLRAVLRDGCLPSKPPAGAVWQSVQRREWLLTVSDYSADVMQSLRAENAVERVDVFDLSLEELFKDFVRGRTQMSQAT